MRLFPSDLNLSFDETFEERLPDAYERLLMDTARGNQTLFMRVDEVLAAWEFIDPILALAKAPDTLCHTSQVQWDRQVICSRLMVAPGSTRMRIGRDGR